MNLLWPERLELSESPDSTAKCHMSRKLQMPQDKAKYILRDAHVCLHVHTWAYGMHRYHSCQSTRVAKLLALIMILVITKLGLQCPRWHSRHMRYALHLLLRTHRQYRWEVCLNRRKSQRQSFKGDHSIAHHSHTLTVPHMLKARPAWEYMKEEDETTSTLLLPGL
eukprot:jgi/Botrbrau1/10874/Bobra.0025s0051.1